MKHYWGDLHNHCGISYGYGSLENALKAARGQLDFCAVIGHASWYDIPERTAEVAYLVDFHKEGFAKLAEGWEQVLETVKNANVSHEFVTFQGFEAHSSQFGDHHYISKSDDLPLVEGERPQDIIEKLEPREVIAVPHHVGYTPGYRGGNWENMDDSISPIVEVYSKHGSGMSDTGLYPYYHDMGPRDSRSTVYQALKRGHKFGFVGSTDHHAGYPGSYGDGRLAVMADEKTRESIWEALLARRTYAVTGDKIICDFNVNGARFGSEIKAPGKRTLQLDIKGCDALDKVVIYKNLRPWQVVNGETLPIDDNSAGFFKVRIEMGWGNAKQGFAWKGEAEIQNGKLASVETCFRGRSILAPAPDLKDSPQMNDLGNEVTYQTEQKVGWSCTTFKNPTTQHPHTSALILEIEGDLETAVKLSINGLHKTLTVAELLQGSWSGQLESYNSEAVLVHRAVPAGQYVFNGSWSDTEQESDCDIYHVEIRQLNQQMAWISPVNVRG